MVRQPNGSLIVDRRGRPLSRIHGRYVVNGSMSWSPDGRRLLLYDKKSGRFVSRDVADGIEDALHRPAGATRPLGWAGSRIVWHAGAVEAQRLVTTDDRARPQLWTRLDTNGMPVESITWSAASAGNRQRLTSRRARRSPILGPVRLVDRLPRPEAADPDALFEAFTGWTTDQGLELYPAQTEALIELVSGSNVILATPTGSGKSLVAAGAHFAALAQGRRSVYTAPIKALVSEKFFALCDMFGADKVGMLTGDASVNPDAPIITATAEVLANQALREGADTDVGVVVMDEFHYYSDPDRGWAWQVPLLELPQAQFLLMSATLGDVSFFESDLSRRTSRATAVVATGERPVPLTYYYATTPVHETLDELLHTDRAPVYVVHFTQVAAIERAQALTSVNVATRAETRRDRRDDRWLPLLGRLRQDAVAAGPARHRRPPRRHAPPLPAAGGDARAGRAAQGDLRHRHARRRHQRADPHRPRHGAVQVRRLPHPAPHRARVPPGRGPRGPGRLRHRRDRRGAGARPRRREREGEGQGRRRPQEAAQAGASASRPRASCPGASRRSSASSPPSRSS